MIHFFVIYPTSDPLVWNTAMEMENVTRIEIEKNTFTISNDKITEKVNFKDLPNGAYLEILNEPERSKA